MLRWAIDLLKRDAFVCGAWALALSWPDPLEYRVQIAGVAAFSLFYISFMRLVRFGYVALVTGGEVRPSWASRLAIVFATACGFLQWVEYLQFENNEGWGVIQELVWCVLPPSFTIAVWDWIRERPTPHVDE